MSSYMKDKYKNIYIQKEHRYQVSVSTELIIAQPVIRVQRNTN